jgi:hypothetical protein
MCFAQRPVMMRYCHKFQCTAPATYRARADEFLTVPSCSYRATVATSDEAGPSCSLRTSIGGKQKNLVLISERDTFYGRMLSLTYAAALAHAQKSLRTETSLTATAASPRTKKAGRRTFIALSIFAVWMANPPGRPRESRLSRRGANCSR